MIFKVMLHTSDLKGVKLPENYGSNISRCVQLEQYKILGARLAQNSNKDFTKGSCKSVNQL